MYRKFLISTNQKPRKSGARAERKTVSKINKSHINGKITRFYHASIDLIGLLMAWNNVEMSEINVMVLDWWYDGYCCWNMVLFCEKWVVTRENMSTILSRLAWRWKYVHVYYKICVYIVDMCISVVPLIYLRWNLLVSFSLA